MKFITALSACMVLVMCGGGYAFSTWSVIAPEHVWIAIAMSASAVMMMLALTLFSASYTWPARYETMKYWQRDADYVPYSDDIQVAVPHERLKTLSGVAMIFGLFLLVGILAVAWARNNGLTLQPQNLGPTLEPLAMLALLAVVGTALLWYVPPRAAQPTPA